MLTSLDIAGTSWLHRMATGGKLLALAISSLTLTFVDHVGVLAAALVASLLIVISTGLRLRQLWVRTWPVLLTIAVLALVNALVLAPRDGLVTLLRLPAILFVASAVTATTTLSAFIDCLTWMARPLERVGLLRAADLGLAVGLVLRFVPEIAARYATLREAHQARGIPLRWHRLIGPLVIATLREADGIADAIDARGIRGQNRGG